MKIFLLQFIALHTTFAIDNTSTFPSDNVVSQLHRSCQDIACPFKEGPVCVKMRYSTGTMVNKTFYIIMAAKCEMKYIKCYNGLGIETTELPMKFCEHSHVKKSKIRIKRNANVSPSKSVEDKIYSFVKKSRPLNMKKIMEHAIAALQKKRKNDAQKNPTENNNEAIVNQAIEAVNKNRENDKHRKGEIIFKSGSSIINKPSSYSGNIRSKDLRIRNTRNKIKKPLLEKENKGLVAKLKYDTMALLRKDRQTEQSPENVKTVTVKQRKIELDYIYIGSRDEPDQSSWGDHPRPKPMQFNSGEPHVGGEGEDSDDDDVMPDIGSSKTTQKVNIDQYTAQCPSVCPARVLMVCGRCKHGIYRTFMSNCHLRQFTCNTPDEGLSLVSRYPCGLSAPYLANMDDPQGVVEEQEDDDPVLRFITCRSDARGYRWMKMSESFDRFWQNHQSYDYGRVTWICLVEELEDDIQCKDDPRCNFYKPKKYLLHSDENIAHREADQPKLTHSDFDSSGDRKEPHKSHNQP